MSVYALSDLHGCLDIYKSVKALLNPEDKVYFLGDAGDRGPQSWETIKAIARDPQFIYLKGNHEDMLVAAAEDYFKNDEYTCIAPLVPFKKSQSENQQLALTNAFNTALNDVFKSSMRAWRKAVQAYVLENANFLIRLLPEIEFVVKGTELINSLRETGNPLCFPTVLPVSDKKFSAKGIYNPVVASKINGVMVDNDFDFDSNGTFYVLSGPNRGGKSVITVAPVSNPSRNL